MRYICIVFVYYYVYLSDFQNLIFFVLLGDQIIISGYVNISKNVMFYQWLLNVHRGGCVFFKCWIELLLSWYQDCTIYFLTETYRKRTHSHTSTIQPSNPTMLVHLATNRKHCRRDRRRQRWMMTARWRADEPWRRCVRWTRTLRTTIESNSWYRAFGTRWRPRGPRRSDHHDHDRDQDVDAGDAA